MSDTCLLRCTELVKTFGDHRAVDDVSFAVEPGETYGLLGPNGAGKTTTISMICGLLEPDRGTVVVDGLRVTPGAVTAKRAIGYVPQDLAVYPDLTARENLRFFGRLHGLSRRHLATRVGEVLELVGLADRADDRTDTYSGGMKRRLNIAVGLLHQPRLLVLDEPTVGVDPQSRNAILASIEALGGSGTAVLYTTHYMEEAERLCDRVGIIDDGRLRAEGTRRELTAMVGENDRVRLEVDGDVAEVARRLRELPDVLEADAGAGTIELLVRGARQALPQLLAGVTGSGAAVTSVEVQEPDLEAVFLHLTGRALRD